MNDGLMILVLMAGVTAGGCQAQATSLEPQIKTEQAVPGVIDRSAIVRSVKITTVAQRNEGMKSRKWRAVYRTQLPGDDGRTYALSVKSEVCKDTAPQAGRYRAKSGSEALEVYVYVNGEPVAVGRSSLGQRAGVEFSLPSGEPVIIEVDGRRYQSQFAFDVRSL